MHGGQPRTAPSHSGPSGPPASSLPRRSPRGTGRDDKLEPWCPGQPTVGRPRLVRREGRPREGSRQVSWPLRLGYVRVWGQSPLSHSPTELSECSWGSGPPRKAQVRFHSGLLLRHMQRGVGGPSPGRIRSSLGREVRHALLHLCSAAWTNTAHPRSGHDSAPWGPRPKAPRVRSVSCASLSHPAAFRPMLSVRLFFPCCLPCSCLLQP